MKVTYLTTEKVIKNIELNYCLQENLELCLITENEYPKESDLKEIILIDKNQEYINDKYDVMYFKFNDEGENCIYLGKFNNGILPK